MDSRVINDDTTRRYFETHLAYRTIKDQIDKISIKSLQNTLKFKRKFTKSGGAPR